MLKQPQRQLRAAAAAAATAAATAAAAAAAAAASTRCGPGVSVCPFSPVAIINIKAWEAALATAAAAATAAAVLAAAAAAAAAVNKGHGLKTRPAAGSSNSGAATPKQLSAAPSSTLSPSEQSVPANQGRLTPRRSASFPNSRNRKQQQQQE
ncbi:hypothetical protein ACSSS7_008407 [Eimeria intestinalis]